MEFHGMPVVFFGQRASERKSNLFAIAGLVCRQCLSSPVSEYAYTEGKTRGEGKWAPSAVCLLSSICMRASERVERGASGEREAGRGPRRRGSRRCRRSFHVDTTSRKKTRPVRPSVLALRSLLRQPFLPVVSPWPAFEIEEKNPGRGTGLASAPFLPSIILSSSSIDGKGKEGGEPAAGRPLRPE